MRGLVVFCLLTLLAFVIAVLLGACGFAYEPTSATTAVELMLLSETARHAATLGAKVRGEITETISTGQIPCVGPWPTGWYQAGVAWYYRPMVGKYVSIEPEAGHETATNVSAHECCHVVSPFHDVVHWRCSASIATPTYPYPGF